MIDKIEKAVGQFKKASPVLSAVSDIKEIMEFLAENKGAVSHHAEEIQRMRRVEKDLQSTIAQLNSTIQDLMTKRDRIRGEVDSKIEEARQSYEKAETIARNHYMEKKEEFSVKLGKEFEQLENKKSELKSEISLMEKKLQSLNKEWDDLRSKLA